MNYSCQSGRVPTQAFRRGDMTGIDGDMLMSLVIITLYCITVRPVTTQH